MNKPTRQRMKIQTLEDLSEKGKMTKSDLLSESELFDKENYNPMNNLSEKEVLINKKRSDVITLRLTSYENKLITDLADENGLSKSAFVRMVVKKALNNTE
mgnify:CR=1 FL=1